MSELAKAMRQAIEHSGVTRYALWKLTGIDQGQLSRFAKGQSGLSIDALERLASVLDLEIIIRPAKGKARKTRER